MKNNKHTSIAKCSCGKYIISRRSGEFTMCECGETFIDQERFSGAYYRTGGDCEFIEQICPPNCDNGDAHITNQVIDTKEELEDYLKNTYERTT